MMTEQPVIRGFMRMCGDGWQQGWHERNGGNLTYRMRPEGGRSVPPVFTAPREWNAMGVSAENLAGEYFITTGSGKFLRNVQEDPAHNIGIVEINAAGDRWRIVWGLEDGAHPTSEFPSHFFFEPQRPQNGDKRRVPRDLPRAHAEPDRDDLHPASSRRATSPARFGRARRSARSCSRAASALWSGWCPAARTSPLRRVR